MKPAVRFENVTKRYELGTGQTSIKRILMKPFRKNSVPDSQILWALRDVNFEIPPGSALGLVGPNGSGKTTSLKLLSKITFPTSGKVHINGRISALIELGAGFHPDLTGRENVYLNGTILGMKKEEIDKRFDQIVDFSGIERFIDTPVKRYSSGMYVRLGFSVAAHVEPDVLLVDEVLAVGDAQFRQKCARRIEELQAIGTTIVFVAHNLYLVRSVCDKAVFLLKGVVQEQGDVDGVLNTYENWLIKQQIEQGGAPAAAMRGKIDGHSQDVAIQQIEMRNLNSGSNEDFNYDDPAEIRVHYKTEKPIQDPNLVVRITRADGATAAMIRTADYGLKLDDLEGEGVISIKMDQLQLATGGYVLNVSLLGPIDGVALAWGNSRWVQVSGISLGHEESSGVFVPNIAGAHVEGQASRQRFGEPSRL
ncbi:MAG: ABC transporter ATP-binding protein [Ardenticatenaceae bacterium]|nr:ABC transporter ATP-binding protein [Anaerolineales bacterium]MCB8940801.1 ABC transporter ATP-binding protein [Ardenticatenaceae bacterium]MCB8972140.1 ABC transporter ATP-binding protein [Ardenticatenaceae bacterium]